MLVKAAKPGQELRVDMPTIGPMTIDQCKRAGVSAIHVGAETTLIIDVAEVLARADAAGIALTGFDLGQFAAQGGSHG
ncbi:MAG: LpxI family protein [Phyllobacteriaceae bacterium]|nr:LpxI family protein [Phyllobacteriaceae bacterium]